VSFSYIQNFQMNIYRLLADDVEIKQKIDKIYLSAVQDAKYPFLLINIVKVENKTLFSRGIYEVDFEISVFARDKSQLILIKLADLIIIRLDIKFFITENYIIAGLKAAQIDFQKSQDLVTTKLLIPYKALIKDVVIF